LFENWHWFEGEASETDLTYLRSKRIDPYDESKLLEIVATEPMSLKGIAAFGMLMTPSVATGRAIPVMKALCLDRREDFQVMGLGILDAVAGPSELMFYRSLAKAKERRAKPFLFGQTQAIGRWGDSSDVPVAADILRRGYAKPRKSDWRGTSTPLACLIHFLIEHEGHLEAKDALGWIRKRWATVPAGERKAVELTVPEFSDAPSDRWVVVVGRPTQWTAWMDGSDPHEFMSIPIDVTHPRFEAHVTRAARFATAIVVTEPHLVELSKIQAMFKPGTQTVVATNPGVRWNQQQGKPWRRAVEAARKQVCDKLFA
jgi:hypothetical protein